LESGIRIFVNGCAPCCARIIYKHIQIYYKKLNKVV
jgi:hypothetical protein